MKPFKPVAYTSKGELEVIAGSKLNSGRFWGERDEETPIALYALPSDFLKGYAEKTDRLDWLEEKFARLDRIAADQFRKIKEYEIEIARLKELMK